LATAARTGDTAAIRALIQAGADPDQPSGINGWTPLMHAIHRNQRESVFALADAGADPDAICCEGLTALMMAAGYGQPDLVVGLLERGADPERRNSAGHSALDAAITGAIDIDAMTAGHCQTETVRAILGRAPGLARSLAVTTRAAAAVKACPGVQAALDEVRKPSATIGEWLGSPRPRG